MDLRGKLPIDTFQYIVTTDGQGQLYDGTGSLMTSLTITSITASYVTESYSSESYVNALDIEVTYLSASYSQFSTMSAVFGNIDNLASTTISASSITASFLYGTSSWATNATSASYAPDITTYTSSLYGTASWANISLLTYQIPHSSSITPFVTTPESTGSVYVDVVNKLLYIYSGTSWMSSSLA